MVKKAKDAVRKKNKKKPPMKARRKTVDDPNIEKPPVTEEEFAEGGPSGEVGDFPDVADEPNEDTRD